MPPLPANVPAGLAAVIKRCLQKEPVRRYQRASELRAALEALEISGTVAAAPPLRDTARHDCGVGAVRLGFISRVA